jgi:hypothetical protein
MNNAHLLNYIEGLQMTGLDAFIIYSDLDVLNNVGIVLRHPNDFLLKKCNIKYPDETLSKSNLLDCSICLMKIDYDNIIITLDCNHIFHSNCLKKWGKNSCPYCRANIN